MPIENLNETKSIKGIEIFSCGKWNGDEYTIEDLQEMVKAFEENKNGARPYIKLGHDSKQKLLQEDGLPAAGWIDKIYIQGNKLIADVVDIPSKIYALIKARAYRKVSSEIFWNIKIGEKTYKRMLSAVALLGSDTPGVMNLNDILAMYNLKETYEKIGQGETLDLKCFDLDIETKKEFNDMPTEKELELEKQLAEQKAKAEILEQEKKDFSLKLEKEKEELETLKKFKAEAEAEKAKLQAEKEEAEKEAFFTKLQADKLASPAMKEHVMELLGPDKKEYTAGKLNKQETIAEMLKLFSAAKEVNFANNSSVGDKGSKDYAADMDKKAKAYMDEHKCSYSQAMKAIMKDKQK